MNDILDIDALPDRQVELQPSEAPQKWHKRNVVDWYFALDAMWRDKLKDIKRLPEDFTEISSQITRAEISEKMGKNKSHLAPSQWERKNTPARRAKAFIVCELDKINHSLRLAWVEASEKQFSAARQSRQSKAALARANKELVERVKAAESQSWGGLLTQLNEEGEALAIKVAELESALKKAKESAANQRRVHADALKSRALDLAEIDRLTQLNASLSGELAQAQKTIDQLSNKASGNEAQLVVLTECEFDINSPPESINPVAWAEWIAYRTEKRKKVSPTAAKKQWCMLASYPPDVQACIINESIANDYQGLFPPKSMTGEGTRGRSLAQDLTDTSWAD